MSAGKITKHVLFGLSFGCAIIDIWGPASCLLCLSVGLKVLDDWK
jgi:hypothetical protein